MANEYTSPAVPMADSRMTSGAVHRGFVVRDSVTRLLPAPIMRARPKSAICASAAGQRSTLWGGIAAGAHHASGNNRNARKQESFRFQHEAFNPSPEALKTLDGCNLSWSGPRAMAEASTYVP
eukprot:212284-Chlamydomonas_euryale.AAC.3